VIIEVMDLGTHVKYDGADASVVGAKIVVRGDHNEIEYTVRTWSPISVFDGYDRHRDYSVFTASSKEIEIVSSASDELAAPLAADPPPASSR